MPNLEKRTRELDEREKVLKLREDLLASDRANVEKSYAEQGVIEKQIAAKKLVLEAHNKSLDELTEKSNNVVEGLRAKEEGVKKSIKAVEGILADLKRQEANSNASIRVKKSELINLQTQVKETKKYLKEQEVLTENTISEWNTVLQDFRKEADTIQAEKNKLSADIIRLEQDKTAMTVEAKKQQDNLESLAATYEQKVKEYKASLQSLDDQCNQKKNELGTVNAVIDARKIEVETRERSLKLKEGNVDNRERELDQKERRLKGAYGMASIPWDGV